MISPIEMNGVLSRTQDIASLRFNEENKAALDNVNVIRQMDVKGDETVHTVKGTSESDGTDTRHDAKEKGKNEFVDIRKKNKKRKDDDTSVKVKGASPGFDLKI
ncbi:MAG: hypothetical protein K5857_00825 [Lachnospiraceae bacterium]|nr:hypothetical protein [Lachnospiraceae bacterium]